jgi:hypothetical protein
MEIVFVCMGKINKRKTSIHVLWLTASRRDKGSEKKTRILKGNLSRTMPIRTKKETKK